MPLPPELMDSYRQWWQLTESAAAATTPDGSWAYQSSDVISAAAAIAADSGTRLSFQVASQIPSLFSIARANASAARSLLTAAPDAAITGDMVGNWPTSAAPSVQEAQPMFLAKASFTYQNMLGEDVEGWVSLTGLSQIPMTAGNLAARLQGAAMTAYAAPPGESDTPKSDAERLNTFGSFTSISLYAM